MSDPKSNSVHLSERDIKGYLNSELPDKEMHRIERHLLLCDLCAEAVEGYEAVPLMDIEFEVDELNQRIAQRSENREKRIGFPILRIAAIALALIISGIFVSNYFIKNLRQEKLTEKRKSELKENNIKKDSIQAPKSYEKSAPTNTQKEEKAPVIKPQLIPERKVSELPPEQSAAEDTQDDFMITDVDEDMGEIPVIEFSIALDKTEKMDVSAPIQSMERSAAKKESDGFAEGKTIQNEELLLNESPSAYSTMDVNSISGAVAGVEILENQTAKDLNAQPSIGFDAYKLYLKDNVKFPIEAIEKEIKGKVVLKFDLDSLGNMDHFVIEKSLGFGCDEEAIRLIKEGPSWNPAIKKGQSINQEIKIKINFK